MNTGISGIRGTRRILYLGLLFCLSIALGTGYCAPSLPVRAAWTDEKPETNSERDRSERDRQVLEALLLHLLADRKYNLSNVSRKVSRTTIVLHPRTPKKTGMIDQNQMRGDIGNHTLPPDAEQDLRQRNTATGAGTNRFDAVAASFAGWKFADRIVVDDWEAKQGSSKGRPRNPFAFERAHPRAKGWVEAYLPGYSKDGSRALVRAWTGPSGHGATVTALLERNPRSGKWQVKWYHLAFYV